MNTEEDVKKEFYSAVTGLLGELKGEIAERNERINERDNYIYEDGLTNHLDIPIGHDRTGINWLRRTVEVHTSQFIGKGFQVISTSDTRDSSNAENEEEQKQVQLENKRRKQNAELRRYAIDAIIRDNGGQQLFKDLGEASSAVGDAVAKVWYDAEEKQLKIVPVETIENLYVYWSDSNFRNIEFVAYLHQMTESAARRKYPNLPDELVTTKRGYPMDVLTAPETNAENGQHMVTVMEVTGRVPEWTVENKMPVKGVKGREKNMHAVIVGGHVAKVESEQKRIPRYYIFPNKREPKRPYGRSDITDAAIEINLTYIETLSDWRTVASKVNFPKYKAYGFPPNVPIPKPKPRTVEVLALGDAQDLVELSPTVDPSTLDFRQQMEELKEQYIKETGLSRVLFDDPNVNSDSNQALLTTMKSVIDKANAKRSVWEPILVEMFTDALKLIAEWESDFKPVLDDDNWHLYVRWPSVLQNEDPLFQQMLLNRWNANTMSLATFLERQGESPEEIDRMRDEMSDPLTASILSRTLANLAAQLQTSGEQQGPDVKVNLRGDLTPYQEANLASQMGFNQGPFPASAGPQGTQGNIAEENLENQGFIQGNPFQGGTPIQRGPDGQPVAQPNPAEQTAVQSGNQEGQQPISQPGSGRAAQSPQGAIDQRAQNDGAA